MKVIVKTYLFPKHMRMGMPCIQYVTKELSEATQAFTYWLGVAHGETRFTKSLNGTTRAYGSSSKVAITEMLYEAFVAESKLNHRQYVVKQGWAMTKEPVERSPSAVTENRRGRQKR